MKYALALFLALVGCAHVEAELPAGFAAYEPGESFRAVSADGVVYRVRKLPNEPLADQAFWSEALQKHMVDAGYTLVSEGEFEVAQGKGYLLELAAPQGAVDVGYLIGLWVNGETLVLAESAGEMQAFELRRAAVQKALSGVVP